MPGQFHRVLLACFCIVLSLAFLLAETNASAAPAAGKSPLFECCFTELPITIDGKADEAAWRDAQIITNFAMPWLGAGNHPAPSATRARLLWDREYLYFFAEMEDADLYADVTNHDGVTWDNDVFELFFKPSKDKRGYYEFQVNAANAKLDMFLPSRGAGGYKRFAKDGEFALESAVVLRGTLNDWQDRDEGWSVEGRIPWRDFMRTGGRPATGEEWSFSLCRYDYSTEFDAPSLSTISPLTWSDFHHFEDYATLRFTGPKQNAKAHGIEKRVLWTNSRVVGSPDPLAPYRTVHVFTNLPVSLPVAIASEPGSDRLIFIEHTAAWGGYGKVRRFRNQANAASVETLLELGDTIYGITFHPNFAQNGYLYLGCNGPWDTSARFTRIVRYTMSRQAPYRIDPQSRLLIIEWPSDGHNGGDMVFGKDGMLYVTSGDGTSDSDRNIAGQDLSKLTAKVLRIDVDHPGEGKPYSVPNDNPFTKTPGARPETWAYGLRNPWRITLDAESGRIWVGENGQDLWEMARMISRGANYGWSVYEGSHPFNLKRQLGPQPVTPPTVEHSHSEFRSLTGGIVYYGRKLPKMRGAYIYGDYSTGRIWGAKHNGTRLEWDMELVDTPFAITGFGVDADGELLIVDEGTGFYRLEPAVVQTQTNRFPRKLSETGLFVSVKDNKPHPALIPYEVNSPLWSDGATKERFIALPPDSKIEWTLPRGWTLPEGAVLVKTFALPMARTKDGWGAIRRIETRLLTRQQKEWVGYSYIWDDDQTDATLVDAAGLDKDFTVAEPKAHSGTRGQTWHYPSRAECMTCHSRAANFVLGIREDQLNREHDFGGVVDNQLRVLEHLGVLKVDWAEYEKDAINREAATNGISASAKDALLKQLKAAKGQREPLGPASMLPRDPARLKKLPDPLDAKQSLEARAKSYLQGNCAHCHIEAGGGNALMELEFSTALAGMHILDVKPQHHTFDLPDARLIAPGHPERSVLLHRIANRDAGHMPPLASVRVDEDAIELLRQWIGSMAQ
jgi:uncharacterized repeat protein (TIGR03806 family)